MNQIQQYLRMVIHEIYTFCLGDSTYSNVLAILNAEQYMQQDFNNNISLYTNCIVFKWQKRKEYYHLHAMILPARKSLFVESIKI